MIKISEALVFSEIYKHCFINDTAVSRVPKEISLRNESKIAHFPK